MLAAMICATAIWAQTTVSTDEELRTAIQTDGANITVTADIDLSNSTLSIESGTTITIDLNGHTLDRKLTERGKGGGQVITVRSRAKLNLSNGTLKGGWGGNAGGLSNESGTANLTNVNITGCKGDDTGGGICNLGGTLTMTGGSITNNTCFDHGDPAGGGGLFNAEGATAMLTGVTITGNEDMVCGGGGICNYGTLNLDGCTITGNKARTVGGGIWSGNEKHLLKMQGANIITDNTAAGVSSNLFMLERRWITLTGSITGSRIGITLDVAPNQFTDGYATYHNGEDPNTFFTCDRPETDYLDLIPNEPHVLYVGEIILEKKDLAGKVPYIERSWDSENQKVVSTTKILTEEIALDATPTSETQYKRLKSSPGSYLDLGTENSELHEYYVVSDDEVKFESFIVKGPNVHIILCDNAWLHLNSAVGVVRDDPEKVNTVYFHAQSSGPSMGKQTSGSIGDSQSSNGVNIEIHGGKFDLQGNTGCAAIGGEYDNNGNITIFDGHIKAIGGDDAAGIGGGYMCSDYGNITIYGGRIDATGSAGIGGGSSCENGKLTIWDGAITAHGQGESAGIGSNQYSGDYGAGTITINGGYVRAYGDQYAAGIGGGDGIRGGTLIVNGGRVDAYGGTDAAGIGGGEGGNGGIVTISGGYVYAEGNDLGAGIGGGQDGDGADVTITGGTVIAKAGRNEDAGLAIGRGDGNGAYGSLTLGDDRCVLITSNLWRSKKENRISDCKTATHVRIIECAHGDATASVVNGDKHDISNCKWCYITGEDAHTFRDYGECDVCHLIRLEDEGDNSALFSKWADGKAHDFLLNRRKLTPNEEGSRAYTVCLPFDMDLSGRDDLMVYTLSYIKNGQEMVFTQTAKKIEAGKPYLIVIHKGELELLGHSPLTVKANEGVRVYDWDNREQPLGWWRGTLTKIESADAAAVMAYALQSVGDFRRIRPDTYWAWWGAFRSMYCPDELPATNKFTINKGTFNGFGGQIVNVSFEGDAEIPDDGATGITNTNLQIDKVNSDNVWYDLCGRRISVPSVSSASSVLPKGVYIYNGRKLVVK